MTTNLVPPQLTSRTQPALATDPVPRRQCGKSGLSLPVLGMGCWAFGNGDYWGSQTQREVDEVVHYAVDHGCNFFDTAEAYNAGASEAALGAALKNIPRERVVVCTKISPSNTEPEEVVAHCDASLRRLQTDYVDLYMIHWPITPHSIHHFAPHKKNVPSVTEAFASLRALQQAGKIRHIGVSNFGRAKLTEAMATGTEIAVNELPYSLLARAVEADILPFCREQEVGVLGYMALLQGVLSDKYGQLNELPEVRRRTRHFDGINTPLARHQTSGAELETMAALQSIRSIAKREGMTTSDLSLKWAFAGKGITSCLCGSRSVNDLKANIKAATEPLPSALVAELDAVTDPLLRKLGPSFDYYENSCNDRTK